jgi:phenylalanyl-tRNA synthetase beta chain
VLDNPIAAELDCMRPSLLPNLIEAAGRNARRGFPDAALFEIGPLFRNDRPEGQLTAIAGVVSPHPPRDWRGNGGEPLFQVKAEVLALLEELGVPVGNLQLLQGQTASWWHPGRSAALGLGPKKILVEFGQLHPGVLKALDVDGPIYGFEILVDELPEPKKRAVKTRPKLELSPLMPLSRDFAFVTPKDRAAGDLVRAALGADKALVDDARVFDVYEGPGVPEGHKSVAIEVRLQPREKTLTDADIETVTTKIVAAAEKLGAKLRS